MVHARYGHQANWCELGERKKLQGERFKALCALLSLGFPLSDYFKTLYSSFRHSKSVLSPFLLRLGPVLEICNFELWLFSFSNSCSLLRLSAASYFLVAGKHSPKLIGCYMVKPHGQLVHVSYTHYCASTPCLSTW